MKPVRNWKWYFVLVCMILAFLSMIDIKPSADYPKPEFGQPVTIREYVDFRYNYIQKIVHDERYIYVLFNTEDNYVQVYDLNGDYQFTLSFYKYLNGAMRIAQINEYVYMCDENQNLYIYHGGEFVEFLSRAESVEVISTLDFDAESDVFEVRGASVWRTDGSTDVCVICRPAISWIYQSGILGIFAVCLVIAMCVSIFCDNWKNRKSSNYESIL